LLSIPENKIKLPENPPKIKSIKIYLSGFRADQISMFCCKKEEGKTSPDIFFLTQYQNTNENNI
jgi:hypothetical protein